jgi:uncharacterized protein (DUF1330 family)
MQVENEVQPQPESVQRFLSGADRPVVMLNLLRFKAKAGYADGRASDLTGAEAYGLYAEGVRALIEGVGGRLVFGGAIESVLLGQVEDPWDAVALVEYPSPGALVEMATSAAYQELAVHRDAGLAGQLNIAVREGALDA